VEETERLIGNTPRRGGWLLTALGIWVLFCADVNGQVRASSNRMTDPMFGIGYDTRKVHFEYAPSSIGPACRRDIPSGNYWIFARWKDTDGAEYVYLSGTPIADYDAVTLQIHGSGCSLIPSDWDTPEKSKLPSSIREGLITDLFRRYVEAFGGKKEFVEALRDHVHNDITRNNYTFVLSSEMRRRVLALASELGTEQGLLFEMTDPMFGGLGYDARDVRFEHAPASIGEACPTLSGKSLWLYAYMKIDDTEYFYVSDWVMADNSPALAVVRGTACTVDTSEWTTPERATLEISDVVRRGLITDLFRRHAAAFGGKAAFLRALHPSTTSRAYFSGVMLDLYGQFVKSP
jgi:hypothetical protein